MRPRMPPHRVQHGTQRGYQWEIKYAEKACDLCRQANNDYRRTNIQRKKKQRAYIERILARQDHPLTDEELSLILKTLKKDLKLDDKRKRKNKNRF